MSLALPNPGPRYDQATQIQSNRAITTADGANRKIGADVEVNTERFILRSPNGHRWAITVSNAGVIGATAL